MQIHKKYLNFNFTGGLIIMELSYEEALEKANNMITLNKLHCFFEFCGEVKHSEILTEPQKKYIMQKIENYRYSFYKSFCQGRIYVWNMPHSLRNYKSYLYTLNYIEFNGNRTEKNRLYKKFYLSLKHENVRRGNGGGKRISKGEIESMFDRLLWKVLSDPDTHISRVLA
jgi:hypothetical protein